MSESPAHTAADLAVDHLQQASPESMCASSKTLPCDDHGGRSRELTISTNACRGSLQRFMRLWRETFELFWPRVLVRMKAF